MSQKRVRFGLMLLCGCLCLALTSASANPMFSIHTYNEWGQELAVGGHISAVPASTFRDMVMKDTNPEHWPQVYREAAFFTPELYPYEGMGGPTPTGEAGLVMAWGPPPPPQLYPRMAAAWDYVYDVDPNLNGLTIEFSIFPPFPSTRVSLNILDKWGNYREWVWHAIDPKDPVYNGELPPMQWSTLVIDPAAGTSNYPYEARWTQDPDPAHPFDLSSAKILRFNENMSSLAPGDPKFPPDPLGQFPGWVWNQWDHVEVHPEPGTMLLLGGGLLGLLRRRRSKK